MTITKDPTDSALFECALMTHWDPQVERCGIVLMDGTVVPMSNGHDTPEVAFGLLNEEVWPLIKKHGMDNILGIYHTHPSNNNWPSQLDIEGWPKQPIRYFIVTSKTVTEWSKDECGGIRRVGL